MNPVEVEWCLYQWFEEQGIEYVHPDDINAFRSLKPNGKLFRCLGAEDGFAILEHAGRQYRVKPALVKPVPVPVFGYGDTVRVTSGGENRPATIREIMWHFQRNEPYFLLDFGGKSSSRRYWSSEIRADDAGRTDDSGPEKR